MRHCPRHLLASLQDLPHPHSFLVPHHFIQPHFSEDLGISLLYSHPCNLHKFTALCPTLRFLVYTSLVPSPTRERPTWFRSPLRPENNPPPSYYGGGGEGNQMEVSFVQFSLFLSGFFSHPHHIHKLYIEHFL